MSLGSERDYVWGEDKSQEQGTSDTIDAASASSFSQRFLGEASSSAIGSLPPAAIRRPRELVSGRRIGRSKHEAEQGGLYITTFVAMIFPLPLVVYMKY